MSVLKIKDENGNWQDIESIRGKDGAIQYSAGNNISIENDKISTSALNQTQVQGLIDTSISALGQLGFTPTVVQQLPIEDIDEHTIYLVPKQGKVGDAYDEYVYVNNNWEPIGSTAIDLSDYYTKSETQEIVENRTPQIFEIKLEHSFLESSINSDDYNLFLPLAKYMYEKCKGTYRFIQAPIVYIYSGRDLRSSYDSYNYQLFFINEGFTQNNTTFIFSIYNIPRSSDAFRKNYITLTISGTLGNDTISSIKEVSMSRGYYIVSTLNNAQTISGKKTFTTLPESSVVPTTDNQLVNKKYVDDSIAAGSNTLEEEAFLIKTMQSITGLSENNPISITSSTVLNELSTKITAALNTDKLLKGYIQFSYTPPDGGRNFVDLYTDYPVTTSVGYYRFYSSPTLNKASYEGQSIYVIQAVVLGTWSNNVYKATKIELTIIKSIFLAKNNTVAYTPTGNYNPATKKYVDDAIAAAITDALGGNY